MALKRQAPKVVERSIIVNGKKYNLAEWLAAHRWSHGCIHFNGHFWSHRGNSIGA